jgi:D-sedoheptulose 7-phosphate isomerase
MSTNKPTSTKPGGHHATGPGGLDAAGFARWYREESLERWKLLDLDAVTRLAKAIEHAERDGNTVYVMGNGGSAATASHMATDLCKTAAVKGRTPVKCVALTDNVAYITAIGNDLSFDEIFAYQLQGLVEEGDVAILISGSGNSPNLLRAAEVAKKAGATTAALLGFDGGLLKAKVDVAVHVPSVQYGVIEDLHMSIGHILTFYLKQRKL